MCLLADAAPIRAGTPPPPSRPLVRLILAWLQTSADAPERSGATETRVDESRLREAASADTHPNAQRPLAMHALLLKKQLHYRLHGPGGDNALRVTSVLPFFPSNSTTVHCITAVQEMLFSRGTQKSGEKQC